jgi:predicted amidohydrolase YtcJ
MKTVQRFMLLAILLTACGKKREAALILFNGKIYTVDSAFTVCEAMVIDSGKIVDTGSSEEMLYRYAAKETTDLQGSTVLPGFIDAHCHFLSYGLGLTRVNLVGTRSWDEALRRVSDAAAKKGSESENHEKNLQGSSKPAAWIIGRGWDQNDWDIKEMPDNRHLDSLFPGQPVLLTRIDGHAALASSEALRQAGITGSTRISGGEFVTRDGKLTGLLIDNAIDVVKKVMPRPSGEMKAEALMVAQQNCFAMGITTVDDAGLMKEDVDLIEALQALGRLKMRVYAMLSDSAPNYEAYLDKGPYRTDRLNVRCFKFYADGALGSRGACLLEDYSDKPGWKGFLLNTPEHFSARAKLLLERGFQVATHCIGDSAYRLMANIYKNAGAGRSHRWRFEHAQVINEKDFEKGKDYIPSVQPTHATSDMYWAQDRLGAERVKGAYAFKQQLRSAGTIALGTDFPVEDISPFKTFFAAVARQDEKGFPPGGYQPENALTREEALRGMTIWAAYSNFEEKEKGSLEPGKVADFIILDKDLVSCEPRDILAAKVLSTFISGEEVYPGKQ